MVQQIGVRCSREGWGDLADAYSFEVTDEPPAGDLDLLEERLNAFNFARTGIYDGRFLTILLRSETGELDAGLHGHTWGATCEIKTIWVAEARRRQGIASQLLQAAESEALRRGCLQILLSTHSFQAPEFYERRGFRRIASVEDYPRGYAHILMVKRIGG